MGVNDFLLIPCPKCGANLSLTSKNGLRLGIGYKPFDPIPKEVADDVHATIVTCNKCGTIQYIDASLLKTAVVPTFITRVLKDIETTRADAIYFSLAEARQKQRIALIREDAVSVQDVKDLLNYIEQGMPEVRLNAEHTPYIHYTAYEAVKSFEVLLKPLIVAKIQQDCAYLSTPMLVGLQIWLNVHPAAWAFFANKLYIKANGNTNFLVYYDPWTQYVYTMTLNYDWTVLQNFSAIHYPEDTLQNHLDALIDVSHFSALES